MKRWGAGVVLALLAGVLCIRAAQQIRWGQLRAMAAQYNARIAAGEQADPGELTKDGILGSVVFSGLWEKMPIYAGEQGQSEGLGLLRNSSVPIGGAGNHSVLTADHLPELRQGDVFYIYIFGRKLTYRVEQVSQARAYDLQWEPGADQCTLVAGGSVIRASRVTAGQLPAWPMLWVPAALAAVLLPVRKKQRI